MTDDQQIIGQPGPRGHREETTAGKQTMRHPAGHGQIEQTRQPGRERLLARGQLLRLYAGETQQCLPRSSGRLAGIEHGDEHGLALHGQGIEGTRQRLSGGDTRRQAGEIPP